MIRRIRRIVIAATIVSLASCEVVNLTDEQPDEPLPVAHIRVCWATDGTAASKRDCVGDGHFGKEKQAPRIPSVIPLAGVPVRICPWESFNECRARIDGYYTIQTTDSDGYAIFPGLEAGSYLFLSDVREVRKDGCILYLRDVDGGVIQIAQRIPSTLPEFHNAHVNELWFLTDSCS